MKRLALLVLLVIGISACKEENLNNNLLESKEVKVNEGVVYPLLMKSRSAFSFETNWENMDYLDISDSERIHFPWGNKSDSNMPYTFVMDIKKEDGWKMLFHTLTDDVDDNIRYIGLYNQRTGFLKILYYLRSNSFSNNGGAWNLEFTSPQQFLNHTSELAIPQNTGNLLYWGCSNGVKQGNKGFMVGWNGFQIQLAYSPNSTDNYALDISSNVLLNGKMDLLGTSKSYSQGTILTHGSTNPLSGLTSDLASVFGAEAKDFIQEKVDSGLFRSVSSRSLISGIGGAIVKYGANKIFSKLTASFSQPTTTRSDLEFSTTGEFNITGNISFDLTSPARSLRTYFSKNYVGEVGVWNLADQPIIYIDPRADHVPDPMDDTYKEYTYRMRGISRYAYDLQINPELQPYIKDQWVDIDLVRFYNEDDCPEIPGMFTYGNLGSNYKGFGGGLYTTDKLIYREHQQEGSMYDDPMDDYTFYSKQSFYNAYGKPLPVVFAPNVESYEGKKFDVTNLFLKFSLYLVTEFEGKRDTTISTRTFVPQVEWDPTLYNVLKDIPMEDLVNIE